MNEVTITNLQKTKVSLEEATVQADNLMAQAKGILEGAIFHYNTDSVRYQNNMMSPEAFLQELYCIERTIWEGCKLHARYVDLFEQWHECVSNKDSIIAQVQGTNNQIIRFMGIVCNNMDIVRSHIQQTAAPIA